MKKTLVQVSAFCVLFAFNTLQAQETTEKVEQLEEVVVSATKFETKKENIGKIIYQINREELENLKGKTVIDVLDNIAGIEVNGVNSSAGKNKSTFIRGGRDKQVLVLIDGVPVSDPSGVNTAFDLRLLTLSQIESIEVMNGAASTLYGSGAATGVINIQLKKSAKKPISLNYQTSIGTNNSQDDSKLNFNDFNQNVSVNGSLKKFSYLATLNTSKTDGLSEASDKNSEIEFASDKFKATNTFVRVGYKFTANFNVQLFSNYDKDVYDYDAGGFSDSDINNGENKQHRVGISSELKYIKGSVKLIASYNKMDRMFDSFNSWTADTDYFEYTGKTHVIDVINNYKISNEVQLISGLNYQKQSNQTNSPYGNIEDDLANYTTTDPYFTIVYNAASGFNINAGARLNNHSEYGNHMVYNVNPSYNFNNNFRIFSSLSTAFIAPSTYQLFSQYGSTTLNPEENKTVELGFVYSKNKLVEVNSVFFYREEDNAIILPDYITYVNAEETLNAKGVETEIKVEVLADLIVKFGHTYTTKSADVDYIPKNKFTALVETNSIKNTYVSLRFKNISKRTYFDQWGTGSNIVVDAYSLVDFYASHTILKDRLSVFTQVNNIFNEDYVETIGYTTKGRNFKIGLDFTF
ncbi:MAG: TonB-dependent receptor plug domain-containing protein [Lutibacter sp.]|uniref:TonB-dependent receptor plug domain-containing protein n=1 Tax=Lutibacter sp. TaxID=1925666 RepID=UPI0019EB7891|nr:TonB-dependent receptor [Lutibacter sp.]NOR27809.1 TonB-dependent receptor plug domain-containing protein [Lutibacter sp.]